MYICTFVIFSFFISRNTIRLRYTYVLCYPIQSLSKKNGAELPIHLRCQLNARDKFELKIFRPTVANWGNFVGKLSSKCAHWCLRNSPFPYPNFLWPESYRPATVRSCGNNTTLRRKVYIVNVSEICMNAIHVHVFIEEDVDMYWKKMRLSFIPPWGCGLNFTVFAKKLRMKKINRKYHTFPKKVRSQP